MTINKPLLTVRLFFLCSFLSIYSYAQKSLPPLERSVSINIQNATTQVALEQLAQEGEVEFSYSPNVIDAQKRVNLSISQKTIREALDLIFQGTVRFKSRANYIVITKNKSVENTNKVVIKGYVSDDKGKITQVSVYEKSSFSSTLTNQYGYYQIKLHTGKPTLILTFSKANYQPKTIIVNIEEDILLNVVLEPKIELKKLQPIDSLKFTYQRDSLQYLDSTTLVRFLIPNSQRTHVHNLQEIFYRPYQASILPYLGSNHRLSGNVVNDYSLNLLVGYSAGTRKLELGGLVNINRGRTQGIQIGGIANVIGEEVHGVQFGGIANVVRDSVYGVQVAGIVNANGRETVGVQIGGIANVVMNMVKGVQIAGITNLVKDSIQGTQIAGILNVVGGGLQGVQVAGITNLNIGNLNGVQVAGISNIVWGEVNGTQAAGIFNFARKFRKGWQIGLINYTDSAANLRQIGLLNFARKGGYKDLEVAYNEMQFTQLSFRSGTPYFYTLFRLGIRPASIRPFWYFAYGFGFAKLWKRNWNFTTEIAYHQLLRTLGDNTGFDQFFLRLQSDFTKKIGKHWGISLGIAVNGLYLSTENQDFAESQKIAPLLIGKIERTQSLWQITAGGQIGIKYLFD